MKGKNFKILLYSAVVWLVFYYLFPLPFLPDSAYLLRVFAGQIYSKIIFLVFLVGIFHLWLTYREFQDLFRSGDLVRCSSIECLKEKKRRGMLDLLLSPFLKFAENAKDREELVALTSSFFSSFRNWAEDRFVLTRVVIWALPLMGFIGTVVGVTMAIAGFRVGEGTSSFVRSFSQVSQGLYTAFDTTFLGLVLVLILMFLYSLAWKKVNSSVTLLQGFLMEKIIPSLEFPGEKSVTLGLNLSELEERMERIISRMEEGAKILATISKALLLSLGEREKENLLNELEKREF